MADLNFFFRFCSFTVKMSWIWLGDVYFHYYLHDFFNFFSGNKLLRSEPHIESLSAKHMSSPPPALLIRVPLKNQCQEDTGKNI